MRSKDVDDSGNATGWTFGVNNGNETDILGLRQNWLDNHCECNAPIRRDRSR